MAPARVIDPLVRPSHLEAAEPPEARGLSRDEVRLLVSSIGSDTIHHVRFRDLPSRLSPGDLLVVNTSGTLNAALDASGPGGEALVLHLSTRVPGGFHVLELRRPDGGATQPYREGHAGMVLTLKHGGRVTLLARYPFTSTSRLWLATVDVPIPLHVHPERHGRPIRYAYVQRHWPASMYRTVFAAEPGSAEMPSAARPFTHALVTRLISAGVRIAPLLLHAGVSSLDDHEPPFEEYYRVPPDTAGQVNAVRRNGGRVIAVGTTVVRALESVTDDRGRAHPGEGWTSLVITPGYHLRAITGLVTGLHESGATHLAIVRQALAAAGSATPSGHLAAAYEQARDAGYLWHEFGDSHLIVG